MHGTFYWRQHLALLCSLFFILSLNPSLGYAYDYHKHLWLRWSKFSPSSKKSINNVLYQEFLKKYLKKQNDGLVLIDYYQVKTEDKKSLKRYINYLCSLQIANYSRQEQLAYWINLYNALFINLILEHLPIESIKEISLSSPLLMRGPWYENLINIDGRAISLYDIKNRIVRPTWNDPRALYAFFDGTVGGPSLFDKPFSASSLDKDLNTISNRYVNSLRGVQLQENILTVSMLYDWFEEDFGGSKQDVIWHLKQFANPSLKKKLETIDTIDNYAYNWHLNAKRDSDDE